MPLYEYRCDACGARFELIRKFSDPPLDVCPTCGKGPVHKLVSSPAFQFKGSGWYVTDYARKPGGESSSEKAASADSKGEPKGESKPAVASDSSSGSDKAAPPATTPSNKDS